MIICKECCNYYEDYGQRIRLCRDCNRKYHREYYNNYSKEKKVKRRKAILLNKNRNAQKIIDYLKENPCENCGEKRIACLQFNHINLEDKVINISEAMARGWSWERVFKEIIKCQVLCANCHMILTAKQFNWYKYLKI